MHGQQNIKKTEICLHISNYISKQVQRILGYTCKKVLNSGGYGWLEKCTELQ